MAAASELTPSEYIEHHLSFFTRPLGEGGFWTLNLDSLIGWKFERDHAAAHVGHGHLDLHLSNLGKSHRLR